MRLVAKLIVLSGILVCVNLTVADEQRSDGYAAIAPLVNDQTIAVVSLDLPRLDFPALQKQVLEPLCKSDADRVQLSIAIAKCQQWSQRLQAEGGRRVYFVTTLASASGFSDLLYLRQIAADRTFVVIPGVKTGTLQEFIDSVQGTKKDQYGQNPRTWVVCREIAGSSVIAFSGLMDQLQSLHATPRPELEKALAAAGDQPICVSLAPPPVFARTAAEIFASPLPGSDQPLGRIVGRGVQWIAGGIDLRTDHFHTEAIIQSADAQAAQSLANLLHQLATVFGKFLMETDKDFPLNSEVILQSLVPQLERDRLVLSLDEKRSADLRSFGQKAFSAAMADTYRHQSVNNLKELGLAMLNYQDIKHQLPDRAIRDKDGKPLLSWRVAILPEIEEGALYKEFHLDEPWDSDHNRKLIERMPEAYRSPDTWSQHPGRTRYVVPVGESLAFPPDHGIPIKEFTDGTSKTIMTVEADQDHAVIWTKPDDLEVDLDNPIRGLAAGKGSFNAGFGDGSVTTFPASISLKNLRALFTRNGGEPTER